MKRIGLISLGFASLFAKLDAQDGFATPVQTKVNTPLMWVFDPMKDGGDWFSIESEGEEMPLPGAMSEKVRREVDAQRAARNRSVNLRGTYGKGVPESSLGMNMLKGVEGGSGAGTPNDNHVAVGNDGKIINVLNTVIRVYDDTGKMLKFWTLNNFINPPNKKVGPIPTLTRTFDPRVMYDPFKNRFIVLFMEGSFSTYSRIIVGFSTSSDPTQPWNVYSIPGKPTKDSIWSDYPIVTQNREDMFFTVNLIGDNATWEEGFTEAIIWQINKADGFNGDTLHKTLYSGIKFNGKSLRSICPVQNGPLPDGTDNYFVTVRPIDKKNDTLFLMHITNTQMSGAAKLDIKLLKTDKPYGFPPSALQPDTSYKLRTNDVRVLSALRVGNTVQYLQNCINFNTFQAHLTHGTIFNIDGDAFIRVKMITDDSLDLGYPAIASAGNAAGDPSSVITFVYSSPWHFPGCAMMYHDRYGEYSSIRKIKKGQSLIYYSFIPKGEQRWGDYEGIQAKYNEKNVFYMVGSYGKSGAMFAYIARVEIRDTIWEDPVQDVRVFPVPTADDLYTEVRILKEGNHSLRLFNAKGQKVREQDAVFLEAGTHRFYFSAQDLAPGIYTLQMIGPNGKKMFARQVMVR